jgi:Domain of unknown function (DUF4177)
MDWEYVTHQIDIGGFVSTGAFDTKSMTDILNWYGAQRWELVSAFTTAHNNGGTMHIGFIFKRPRQATGMPPVQA